MLCSSVREAFTLSVVFTLPWQNKRPLSSDILYGCLLSYVVSWWNILRSLIHNYSHFINHDYYDHDCSLINRGTLFNSFHAFHVLPRKCHTLGCCSFIQILYFAGFSCNSWDTKASILCKGKPIFHSYASCYPWCQRINEERRQPKWKTKLCSSPCFCFHHTFILSSGTQDSMQQRYLYIVREKKGCRSLDPKMLEVTNELINF